MGRLGCITLLFAAVPVAALAQAAGSTPASAAVPPELAGLELWIKIIGGSLAALVTFIGMPAAFLQFSKTRAELRKLRLEAAKLSNELDGARNDELQNQALRISVVDSPQAVVQVETAAGLSGPMLVVIDFVVSFILYQAFSHLLSLSPFQSGIVFDLAEGLLRAIVFATLFLPVYLNGRQARLLLREVADARRKAVASASA